MNIIIYFIMKTSLQTIHHVMHVDIKVANVLILTCEKDDKMHRVGNMPHIRSLTNIYLRKSRSTTN
jgi:hypothetical protein